MTPRQQMDHYLKRFAEHLRSFSDGEREEILGEIGAHIRDSSEQHNGDVAAVLNRLGNPEALAEQYRDSILMNKASRSNSPLVLLRAALRFATKGVVGVFVFVCGTLGYALGAGLVLVGLIKPLAPTHTGLWMQNGVPVSSGVLVVVPPPPAHEVLGWWIIPITLILGAMTLLITTVLIRCSLKLFPSLKARAAGLPTLSHVCL